MTFQEIFKSYTYSLNISLIVMTLVTFGFGSMVVANNKEAMSLFFYKPLIYAGFAAVVTFIAIPLLTIIGRYLQKVYSTKRKA